MRGLIIGKFHPPHKGHHFLIETARSQTDELDVLVVTWKGETLPVALREAWLREIHPGIRTHRLDRDAFDNDVAAHWAAETLKLIGRPPDLVFSSEDYGDLYAELLGCRHVAVDKRRQAFPVSASAALADPDRFRPFLDNRVWEHLASQRERLAKSLERPTI